VSTLVHLDNIVDVSTLETRLYVIPHGVVDVSTPPPPPPQKAMFHGGRGTRFMLYCQVHCKYCVIVLRHFLSGGDEPGSSTPLERAQNLFNCLDHESEGNLTKEEFIAGYMERNVLMSKQDAQEQKQKLDGLILRGPLVPDSGEVCCTFNHNLYTLPDMKFQNNFQNNCILILIVMDVLYYLMCFW
jgi:hypothetical protein